MDVGIDNPYCVALADTMQTDVLYSYNNKLLGGKKVIFPQHIGNVMWLEPNTIEKKKFNWTTYVSEEIKVPILYNYKEGKFTVAKENSVQTFEIKVRFLEEVFNQVDNEQLAQTKENERKHQENEHEVNKTLTLEDQKRREQNHYQAEENDDLDHDIANSTHEAKMQDKINRENRKQARERDIGKLTDEAYDVPDDEEFDDEDPHEIELMADRDKKHEINKKKNDENEKRKAAYAKKIASEKTNAHKTAVKNAKKEQKDIETEAKRKIELEKSKQPAGDGFWTRSKRFLSRKKQDDEAGDDEVAESTSIAPGSSAGGTAPQGGQGQSVLPLQNPVAPAAAPAANAGPAGWAKVKATLIPKSDRPAPNPSAGAPQSQLPSARAGQQPPDPALTVQHTNPFYKPSPRSGPALVPVAHTPRTKLPPPSALPPPVPSLSISRLSHRSIARGGGNLGPARINRPEGQASPSPATPSSSRSFAPLSRHSSFIGPRQASAHRQQDQPNSRPNTAQQGDDEFEVDFGDNSSEDNNSGSMAAAQTNTHSQQPPGSTVQTVQAHASSQQQSSVQHSVTAPAVVDDNAQIPNSTQASSSRGRSAS